MPAAPFREHRISAQDGLSLYCRDYGDPQSPRLPVLCLAGLTRNGDDFAATAARLAETRRVLCPDYRGRGRSARDRNWRNYVHRTDLSDLRHILTALNVHRLVVVGTSYGGLLSMALGVLMPSALAGVVLNDIGPDLAPGGQARILRFIATDRPQPDWQSAVRHLRESLPHLPFRTEAEWLDFAHHTFRKGDDGRLHYDWDVRLAKPLLAGRPLDVDLWALFGSLRRVPLLAFRGALSDLLTPATFERMAKIHPDLEPVTVAGVGHTPALTEPECVSALDAFLARF